MANPYGRPKKICRNIKKQRKLSLLIVLLTRRQENKNDPVLTFGAIYISVLYQVVRVRELPTRDCTISLNVYVRPEQKVIKELPYSIQNYKKMCPHVSPIMCPPTPM